LVKTKAETKVFFCQADQLPEMVKEINEFLKNKADANVSYHNVQGTDFTFVIATVTAIPQKLF
jgi:hypothetical protein